MNIKNMSLLTQGFGTSMTGTSVLTSNAICVERIYGYSIHIVWTGTPAGNFKLQASNDTIDITDTESSPTSWVDVASSTVAAGGAAGSQLYNIDAVHYRWMRLVYTNTSSTGTITVANYMEKGV